MKFAKKRYFEFNNKCSTHFITLKDIETYHGKQFTEQFKEFIKHKKPQQFGHEEGYFYVDYEIAARQTDSFLNPI